METKIEIVFTTKKPLTEEEINEIISDFKFHLDGVYSEPPESIYGAESTIKHIK